MGTIGENNIADLSVLSNKIRILESRIDELAAKICHLEGNPDSQVVPTPDETDELLAADLEANKGLGEWIRQEALLQKTAIVCFIMVFALLLRTVTDYGYINPVAGSFLGLAYVSILAGVGCVFYVTGNRMANVFSISGFLLLFTIVSEGYGRFGTISLGISYAILLTALLTSVAVGIKYRVAKLLAVSLVGVTLSSMVIGFPKVHFPLSGGVFFVANWLIIIAAERQVGSKLKWPVTLLTLLFMAIWAFKAYGPIDRGELVSEYVYINWLMPLLICFVVLYFWTYLRRYFSEARLTVYDVVIPSLNMLLFFLAASVVIRSYWHQPWLLGLLTLAMGFIHFAVGWRLSMNARNRYGGVGGAFVAGAIATALGVPVFVDNVAWAITFWALLAYGLARLSGLCGSGVIRVVSYLYQVFSLMTGLALGVFSVGPGGDFLPAMTAAGALALFGLMQFKWCRKNPAPMGSLIAKLDGKDYSAVILLLVGLTGVFLFFNMAVELFASAALADPANTIRCGRSVILNFGASLLLIMGGQRRNLELIWIAVFLVIVGCIKVFLVDLFNASGIPLVLSVLSFGVVAMVGSITMGRWYKTGKERGA